MVALPFLEVKIYFLTYHRSVEEYFYAENHMIDLFEKALIIHVCVSIEHYANVACLNTFLLRNCLKQAT